MGTPSEAKIRKEIARQGWTEVSTKAGWIFRSPDGVHTAAMHRSPSDHRWFKNFLRDLRAGGFNTPKGWG